MPMNRKLYPANWEAIALQVKQRANWTCENCGKQCRRPGENLLKFCDRIRTQRISECPVVAEALTYPQRYTLTVAHLNHDPGNPDAELRAWCAPCHCRYDLAQMGRKRRIKREQDGQLTLTLGG